MAKPKLGFFSFSCCEGCGLQVLNLEDEILDILGVVEIVNFREAMTEKRDDYDIAFIEGSITAPEQEEALETIRKNAKILVAMGACAVSGGVNRIRNFQDLKGARSYVYGDKAGLFPAVPTKALHEVVTVDLKMLGCPISKSEFLEYAKALLTGRKPAVPTYPVCVTCRLNENVCVFEKGMFCLGPVTRAGCDPMCPTFGARCLGCRGLIDNPARDAEQTVLKDRELTVDEMLRQFRFFQGYAEESK
jgi:sulfhydrogenase subunit delta